MNKVFHNVNINRVNIKYKQKRLNKSITLKNRFIIDNIVNKCFDLGKCIGDVI